MIYSAFSGRASTFRKAVEETIERKLREAEIPGSEVEFDPDEAERIAFKEDALI